MFPKPTPEANLESVSTDSISENDENVNTKKSLDVDSDGNTLSEQQKEFFKDSKVRDENGNLLVVYHGTPTEKMENRIIVCKTQEMFQELYMC